MSTYRVAQIVSIIALLTPISDRFALSEEVDFRVDAELPVCDAQQVNEFNFVRTNMMGVSARDPVGANIGSWPAEKFLSTTNNWYPLDGYKTALCGTLEEFDTYDGGGKEMDWNLFIRPSAAFNYLIEFARPFRGGEGSWCFDDSWQHCRAVDDCLEAEITPARSLWSNPFFPKKEPPFRIVGTSSIGPQIVPQEEVLDESRLESGEICVYGAWIRECVHGNRPEIHPSEMLWWQELAGDTRWIWLLGVQDASLRFNSRDDFDLDGPTPPADWRPWQMAERTAQFFVAFEANPSEPVITLDVFDAWKEQVVEDSPMTADADDGTEHSLIYRGRPLVNVSEYNDYVGVTFDRLCERDNGNVQGFVGLKNVFGKSQEGKEGYNLLVVAERREEPLRVIPLNLSELIAFKDLIYLKPRFDPRSLRRDAIGSQRTLVGDLVIDLSGVEGGEEVISAHAVSGGDKRPVSFKQSGNNLIVSGVSLLSGESIRVAFASGVVHEMEQNQITIAPALSKRIPTQFSEAGSEWKGVLAALDQRANFEHAPPEFKRIEAFTLSASTEWIAYRDGAPGFEEDSPVTEYLNEILGEKENPNYARVFGSESPVSFAWTFEARDITRGTVVSVNPSDHATSRDVTTKMSSSKYANDTVEIGFPEGTELVSVFVTIKVSDVFGTSYFAEYEVTNYALIADPTVLASVALKTTRDAIGLDQSAFGSKVLPKTEVPNSLSLRERLANVQMVFAEGAAEDGVITLGEFRSLLRAGRLYESLK